MGNLRNFDRFRVECHPALLAFLDRLDKCNFQFEVAGLMGADIRALRADDGTLFEVVEVWRSPSEQSHALVTGASEVGPYHSFHSWGLAVDLRPTKAGFGKIKSGFMNMGTWDPMNEKDLRVLGLGDWFEREFKDDQATWGGRSNDLFDPWHFEVHYRVPVDNMKSGSQWWLDQWNALERISDKIKRESAAPLPTPFQPAPVHGKVDLGPWLLIAGIVAGLGLWWFNERKS